MPPKLRPHASRSMRAPSGRPQGLSPFALVFVLLAWAWAGSGCEDSTKPARRETPAVAAESDFHLIDANPNSPRAGQSVSPRDYVGKISAWYFGHST